MISFAFSHRFSLRQIRRKVVWILRSASTSFAPISLGAGDALQHFSAYGNVQPFGDALLVSAQREVRKQKSRPFWI